MVGMSTEILRPRAPPPPSPLLYLDKTPYSAARRTCRRKRFSLLENYRSEKGTRSTTSVKQLRLERPKQGAGRAIPPCTS